MTVTLYKDPYYFRSEYFWHSGNPHDQSDGQDDYPVLHAHHNQLGVVDPVHQQPCGVGHERLVRYVILASNLTSQLGDADRENPSGTHEGLGRGEQILILCTIQTNINSRNLR